MKDLGSKLELLMEKGLKQLFRYLLTMTQHDDDKCTVE